MYLILEQSLIYSLRTITAIQDGIIIVDAEQLPRFLYPHDYTLDMDDMFIDIFRGYLMLRVGPQVIVLFTLLTIATGC